MVTTSAPHVEPSGLLASYRSTQPLWALWLILPCAAGLVFLASRNAPPEWAQVLVPALTLMPLLVLGRLVIEIRGSVLHWRYGFIGWPRWQLAIDDITTLQLAKGPALQAGIQYNGRQRAYTASLGSPAVAFTLRDGRRVLLGSPEAQRLAQFVRARMPESR